MSLICFRDLKQELESLKALVAQQSPAAAISTAQTAKTSLQQQLQKANLPTNTCWNYARYGQCPRHQAQQCTFNHDPTARGKITGPPVTKEQKCVVAGCGLPKYGKHDFCSQWHAQQYKEGKVTLKTGEKEKVHKEEQAAIFQD